MPIVVCLNGPTTRDHTAAAIFSHFLKKVNSPIGAEGSSAGTTNASKYERPKNGNKYKLTIGQHVLPRESIARFANEQQKKCVRVSIKSPPSLLWRHPKNKIFCAMRAWSEREESGFMKDIEIKFQTIAKAVITGTVSIIGDAENHAISNFFALWYMRARYRNLPEQELQANEISGSDLADDQEELLESRGVIFLNKDGKFLYRQLNGIVLQEKVGSYTNELSSIKWGVIKAQEGEFVVPDVPNHTIIPLTPTICFAGNAPHGTIVKSNVAEINGALQSCSQNYFFARDLSKCPT